MKTGNGNYAISDYPPYDPTTLAEKEKWAKVRGQLGPAALNYIDPLRHRKLGVHYVRSPWVINPDYLPPRLKRPENFDADWIPLRLYQENDRHQTTLWGLKRADGSIMATLVHKESFTEREHLDLEYEARAMDVLTKTGAKHVLRLHNRSPGVRGFDWFE